MWHSTIPHGGHKTSCVHLQRTIPAGLVDCWHSLVEGLAVLVDPHLSTLPPLPDSVQFFPNCTWPWGLREGLVCIGWGKSQLDEVPLMQPWGSYYLYWMKACQGGYFRLIHIPAGNPSPKLCKQPNTLTGSLGQSLGNCTLVCSWDFRRRGWMLFTSPGKDF